jgi:tripartite-type tricarboxylate transporter receptor subunit TctC
VARIARAQAYPVRPVRILVGYAPGGVSDIMARLIAPWLSERLGQQFVVENQPGASGNIATEAAVRAAPDGYTLLLAGPNNSYNAALYERLNFNFIRDIAPVAPLCRDSFVMAVNPSLPVKTVAEFIAYAKANQGKMNMGSSGAGSPSTLFGELFKSMTGVDLVAVNYRGVGAALPDLMGGRLEVIFLPIASAVSYIRAGKLRPLGVTGSTRVDSLPDVPTIGEVVPGYEALAWDGIVAPAKTPQEIIAILNREVTAALADRTFKGRLVELGVEPFSGTPAEFKGFIAAYTEKWAKVIQAAGIKAE